MGIVPYQRLVWDLGEEGACDGLLHIHSDVHNRMAGLQLQRYGYSTVPEAGLGSGARGCMWRTAVQHNTIHGIAFSDDSYSLYILTSPAQAIPLDNARDSDSKSHRPEKYSNRVSILRYNLCKFCELWLARFRAWIPTCPLTSSFCWLWCVVFSTKPRKQPSTNFAIFVLVFALFSEVCCRKCEKGLH
jgi:hypothetical protein